MSHLTLQEVIDRINHNYASMQKRPATSDYGPQPAHRPEFYVPRITLRLAHLMFGGIVLPVSGNASDS